MPVTKRTKAKFKKGIALFLLFTIINQVLAPSIAYALTAGPTAPEATNFEPIDTTDIVNTLTGDFTYSIPLLEVPGPEGGYPLALSYHAGIQPNEEASWVGLGWSLNPGAISRNVNGYPDDWSGANGLTRTIWNGGSNETFTGGLAIGYGNASISLGLSFSQDTYKGFGVGVDIQEGANFQIGPISFGLGLSVGVDPYGVGHAGASINATSIIGAIGVQTNFKSVSATVTLGNSLLGVTMGTSGTKPSLTIGGGEFSSANNPSKDRISTSSSGFYIPIPIAPGITASIGYNYTRYWQDNPNPIIANGVLYNGASAAAATPFVNIDDDNYQLLDPVNTNMVDNPDPLEQLGGTYPDFDNYTVSAQGLGGNIRPYIFSSILYNENRLNNSNLTSNSYGTQLPSTGTINTKWQFRFINDFSNSYQQTHPWVNDQPSSTQTYNFDSSPQYGYHDNSGNSDGTYGYDPNTNRLEGTSHIEYFTNDQIADTSPNSIPHKRGFIDCDAAGFTRQTSSNQTTNPSIGKQIGGFMITNSSGVTYHYALPVYSSKEIQRTENFIFANIQNTSNNVSYLHTDLSKPEAYAYTWYLTAITGPDYVSRGATLGKLDPSDWGYWIKFDYGKWTDSYSWRNPSEGVNDDPASPGNTFFSVGIKELYYLDAIETRTHTAIFEKEIRADGKCPTEEDENTPYHPQALYYPQIVNGNMFHPRATLRLNNIYLFQNDQLPISVNSIRQNSSNYNQSFTNSSGVENVHYGQNVIDKNDITPSIISNCLRKIAFNYDYSSSSGCPNSYDPGGLNTYIQNPSTSPPTALLGKLTLLSVDFQGRGGIPMTPPLQFQYDLDPTDPNNQDNISINVVQSSNSSGFQPTPPTNQITPAIIQVQTPGKFKIGDILSFSINGVKYYCTLLSALSNITFNAYFLNNPPSALTSNIPAVRTKNPPYNKDAFDNWGYYKSDFGTGQVVYQGSYPVGKSNQTTTNFNLRNTSTVSNMATDVWSLRKILSGIGEAISIKYEGDTYNRSVLSKSKAILINHATGTYVSPHTYTYNVNPMGIDLNTAFKVGDVLHMVFFSSYFNTTSNNNTYFLPSNSDLFPTPAIIQGVNSSNNQLTIQFDPQMETLLGSGAYFLDANLTVNGNYFNGGGLRTKEIMVDDLNGNVKKTSYNYQMPGSLPNQLSSSGITSYEPLIFDVNNLTFTYQQLLQNGVSSSDALAGLATYRKALYANNSQILSIAREAPSPGVMYEYVSVADSSVLPNGSTVAFEGKTVYQYEVFKPEMLGIYDYANENTQTANYTGPQMGTSPPQGGNPGLPNYPTIKSQAKKERSIKDYTSRIGNLKRIITYDNTGNKLTEKIYHYLHDDLENTSAQNQINNYEPRLTVIPYNGVAYNNMGVIKERYGNARLILPTLGSNNLVSTLKSIEMVSDRETFPTFLTSTTQIDYKNGTSVTQSNLAYDFYTGAVTKTLTVDSYGNRFMNLITPAYTAGGGTYSTTIAYPALGLKTHDDDDATIQHKQMITQQASNYTFSVDINNNPIGVVSASARTWSSGTPVLDQDGNITTIGQSNIWRMEKALSWMPSGSSVNNITPYTSFVGYFDSGGSSNTSWKKTSQITQYNVYSAGLEGNDIDNNYAATRMGYNNSKVLITGGPAHYSEIAYAGAEDALLANGNFSNNISPGSGIIVSDSTNSHTGVKSLLVPAHNNGFSYTVGLGPASPFQGNYSVSVWVKPTAGNANQASLYYQVGVGAAVTPTQILAKTAKGWYLLEMTVPSSAVAGQHGNLIVGCNNGSTATLYFDDFRFQPTSASLTAYVYDNQTGALTYIIGNNNLYTRFQYDAIGRLVRTYKEVLGKPVIPLVKGIRYHYARNGSVN